ncbi:MAG: hypothetical protein WAW90_01905 [Minisyncoccia bacterium]
MEPEKIKEIEAQMAYFKEIEDTMTPEAKQIFLSEINNMILGLNKNVEEYLANMKVLEEVQKS